MKFWLLYIIISAILLSANPVLALNYQNNDVAWVQNWEITTAQLSAAKLLQDYVANYRSKINQLHAEYEWPSSIAIINFNSQTSQMYRNLSYIQNNKYDSNSAWKIMSQIVSDLKVLNTRMKVFLEQEKILYHESIKEKQKSLWAIWQQISNTLDKLLLSISNQLIKKKVLSTKEKRLVESLVVLREQNIKIKKFSTLNFNSQWEMNRYIKEVISGIRLEFQKIKTL